MASRLYLPATTTAAVSPTISADFEHINTARRQMATWKVASAFATTTYTPDAADHIADQDSHFVQFVSPPLAAQTIAAQTVKLQILASEPRASNNMFVAWKLYLCDSTGAVGSTILAIRRDGTEVAASLTNRSDSATTTQVTAAAGDRLVLEIGLGGTPTAVGGSPDGHNGALRFGDASGTDLAEDDSATADNNPWLEFANTLAWQTDPYRDTILATSGIQSYWRLGEASGAQATDELAAAHGTYSGSPTLNQASPLPSTANPSALFDGVDDYANNGAVYTFSATAAISAELWLAWDSSGATSFPHAVGNANYNGVTNIGWMVGVNKSNGKLFFIRGDATTGDEIDSSAGLTSGVWYHVVATYDGTNMRLYLNGVLDAGPTASSRSVSAGPMMSIGSENGGANIKAGIDEVAVYNAALSQGVISDHYNTGRGYFPSLQGRVGTRSHRQMAQLLAQ